MDDATWLAERRKGITATDVAAILGISPWRTALDVYLDKRGELPATPQTEEQEDGLLLEEFLWRKYERRTGAALVKPKRIVVNPRHDWMRASLDRMTTFGVVVEGKTSRTWHNWGEDGTDQIPDYYQIQCQWQMVVTEYPKADLIALLPNLETRIYPLRAHRAIQQMCMVLCSEFWANTQAGIPPEPQWGHPHTPDLIRGMFGVSGGEVALPEALREEVTAYVQVGDNIRKLEKWRKEIQAKLLFAMGEAPKGTLPGGVCLTRRLIKKREHTVKASEYTSLLVHGIQLEESDNGNGNESGADAHPRGNGNGRPS